MIATSNKPTVSIVVTTKNEEKNIECCLESIANQTWKFTEIIVVDNFSTDMTTQIAKRHTNNVFSVGPERSAQRNFGLITKASGYFGMFIDADMILSPNLVADCVEFSTRSNSIGLHVEEVILGTKRLARIRRFERSFYSGTVVDGVRFFSLDAFKSINGFDTDMPPGPEDWDLDKRLKQLGKISMLPVESPTDTDPRFVLYAKSRGAQIGPKFSGILHNESEQSLARYLDKKTYYSPSMSFYSQKWPKDSDVRKQLGFFYRYCLVFVESGKWRKIPRYPMLFIQMMILRLLVGVNYLSVRLLRRSDKPGIY
jgi:glycosyltransferase involved in cell wall biosynthesis